MDQNRKAYYHPNVSERIQGRNFHTLINDRAHVYKGGSWRDRAYYMTPGSRRFLDQDESTSTIGFRCAMARVGPPNRIGEAGHGHF